MPSAGKPHGGTTKHTPTGWKITVMKKIHAKPAPADKKDWNKYMDDMQKETVNCIVENQVP